MKENITDGTPCWCNPELNYKDPKTKAEVWVHKELQMTKEEIIEACKNSLNIYSFTAEALEKLMEVVSVESLVRIKDLTDDEIRAIRFNWERNEFAIDFARAVIAADREKNNGTA